FFSSRRRHTRFSRDWSSDVCSSDLTFANGNVTALTVALGEFGLILSLPLWFQFALGLDALQAGLALLPLAVGSFIASGSIRSLRSEERRVGKECGSRVWLDDQERKG